MFAWSLPADRDRFEEASELVGGLDGRVELADVASTDLPYLSAELATSRRRSMCSSGALWRNLRHAAHRGVHH